MYRTPEESHLATIARLEAELGELRALCGKRVRQRRLVLVAALATVFGVLGGASSAATHAHASTLRRSMTRAAALLQSQRQDLATCEALARSQQESLKSGR